MPFRTAAIAAMAGALTLAPAVHAVESALPEPLRDLLEAAAASSDPARFDEAARLIAMTQNPDKIVAASAMLGREGQARAALGLGPAPVETMPVIVAETDWYGEPDPMQPAPHAEDDDDETSWVAMPAVAAAALTDTLVSGQFELWSGRANLGLRFDSGNTEREDYILGVEATRELSGWGFRGSLDYGYSETDGVVGRDNFRVRARGEHEAGERFAGYLSTDYERDRVASYDWTGFVGGGLAYRALRETAQQLVLRVGPGLRFLSEPDNGVQTLSALDVGADYTARLTDTITFTSESTVLVSGTGRADQNFAVNSALNDLWSIQLKYHYRYEFDPQPGFGNSDQRTDISIVREF